MWCWAGRSASRPTRRFLRISCPNGCCLLDTWIWISHSIAARCCMHWSAVATSRCVAVDGPAKRARLARPLSAGAHGCYASARPRRTKLPSTDGSGHSSPSIHRCRPLCRQGRRFERWWHAWGIFDAASDLQTWAFRAAATASGDVQAIFARAGKYSADWRYEFIPGIAAPASPQASAATANRSTGPQDRTLDANCNPPPGFMEVGARWPLDSLATDRATGQGIVVAISYRAKVVCQRRISRGNIGEPRVAFAGRQFTGVWLANLGNDRFAVVLAEQAAGTAVDDGKSAFSFAVSDAGRWSSTAPLGVHVWSASYGGDAPLVGQGDGRAALVALDNADRPVVIWLEPLRQPTKARNDGQ
jgi:hypothetical protein